MELAKEKLLQLLEQYPIEVERVSNLGPSRYRIDGPFAVYEARVVQSNSGHLRAFVSDYAARRGFFKTQRFIMNLFHDQMIPITHHEVFYVTDWFSGMPLTFSRNDCIQAATTLAKLQVTLEGSFLEWKRVNPELDEANNNAYMTELIKQQRLLKVQWSRLKHLSKQSAPIVNWLEEAVHRADWVIRSLSILSRPKGHSATSLNMEFRFGISELQQFIQFENGRIGVLQTEDPKYGDCILDLALIARQVFRKLDATIVEEMIDAYQALMPIPRQHIDFIRIFCAFPQKIVELANSGRLEHMEDEALEQEAQDAELEARAARQLLQTVQHIT